MGTSTNRSSYIDTLKGILIILVVLGHCGTALSPELISIIYAFHMPLFVLISGYLLKRTDSKPMGGGRKLLLIYLIFNALYLLLDAYTVGISFRRILIPSFALWYILSLIYWRYLLRNIPQRWIDKPVAMVVGSLIVCLLSGFVPIGSEMSFQRATVFWPYFIVGYYFRQYDGISWLRRQNKWLTGVLIAILFIVVYSKMPPFYANTSYKEEMLMSDFWLRLYQLVIGSFICFAVIVLSPEKLWKVTDIGRYTLLIYCKYSVNRAVNHC